MMKAIARTFSACTITAMSVLMAALPALGSLADSAWPMFQHNMFHTGSTPYYGPNTKNLAVKFAVEVGTWVASPVVGPDGTIYIGSSDGCMYAVTADGESVECLYDTGQPIESTPVLSHDDILYFGSNDGNMYAVSTSGELVWSLDMGDEVTSSPAFGPGGNIYIGVGDSAKKRKGTLYAVSPSDGVLWDYPTGYMDYSFPAVDRYGNVYIGTFDGIVYALSRDGVLLWTFDASNGSDGKRSITTSPVISDDTMYITTDVSLIALGMDGLKKWEYFPEAAIFGDLGDPIPSGFSGASPVIDSSGLIYIGGIVGDLHCLADDGETFSLQWTLMIKQLSPLDIDNPVLYSFFSPAVTDPRNKIYVHAKNLLYVYNDRGDPLLFEYELGPDTFELDRRIEPAPAIASNRTLYVASADGTLYAVGPPESIYAISGRISGDTGESVTISIKGAEERSVVTAADGTYTIRALNPGNYLVTPYREAVAFEPGSIELTIENTHAVGIDFTSSFLGPAITAVGAGGTTFSNDGSDTAHVTAAVFHPVGLDRLQSVTADLSGIGGSARQPLYDDRSHGDLVAGDGIFSFDLSVTADVALGPKTITFTAVDSNGAASRKILAIEIINMIVEDAITDTQTEYRFRVKQGGQTLNLVYVLVGDGGSSDRTARPFSAAGGSVSESRLLDDDDMSNLRLQVFSPSNSSSTPDFEDYITYTKSRHQIENADEGMWRYLVINDGPEGAEYSIQLSTTSDGLGVVYGRVSASDTGAPLSDVMMTTDTGETAETADGYYTMNTTAGLFNLFAEHPDYKKASKSVNLQSGSSLEINMTLEPAAFDNGTEEIDEDPAGRRCPLREKFAADTAVLASLRDFRDHVLKKTARGRQYVDLYYRFAPEVTRILTRDSELMEAAGRTALNLLGAMSASYELRPHGAGTVPAQIRNLLHALRSQAGASLKGEIDDFLAELDRSDFIQGLGIGP